MSDISRIDSNFKIDSRIQKDDIRFYNVNEGTFGIYGVFYDSGKFRRLPEAVAKAVSEKVHSLHTHTAGGRIRFKTDSPYVAIHTKMPRIGKMPHFALTGSAGFDLYVGEKYVKTFVPPFDIQDGYESCIEFGSSKIREITINFPLYSAVSELYVGLSETATLLAPEPYKTEKPIVFYGSSITQGGCATRPGNSYESIVSRRLNANFINLGFSGSAKAEDAIAEYISKLDMAAFVYDYDHNAPSVEHLKKTHQKMFRMIRNAQPDLPVLILSRPKYSLFNEEKLRLSVIKETYDSAKAGGDEKVYFIDGPTLMAFAKDDGTVDGTHPNDLGFASMAKAVGDMLEKII